LSSAIVEVIREEEYVNRSTKEEEKVIMNACIACIE
jgi:hypothetical protein